jgi:hypothetical protein
MFFTNRTNVQGGLYIGWYIQCHNPNYPQKFIIMDFFLLVELEIKLITFYHHTLKYHNTSDEKIKQEKIFKKIRDLKFKI